MLVLTRMTDEVIRIETPAGVIDVMVTDIRRDSVRLGITAPKEFAVNRLEVLYAKQRLLKGRTK